MRWTWLIKYVWLSFPSATLFDSILWTRMFIRRQGWHWLMSFDQFSKLYAAWIHSRDWTRHELCLFPAVKEGHLWERIPRMSDANNKKTCQKQRWVVNQPASVMYLSLFGSKSLVYFSQKVYSQTPQHAVSSARVFTQLDAYGLFALLSFNSGS